MKVDVSEIKVYRACKRQWMLSSRNKFHLRPMVPAPALAMGTLFHSSLASLYLQVPLEKVMELVKKEMQTDQDAALLAMIPGYAKQVLPKDLERFLVLDIEHKFEFVPTTSDGECLFPPEPAFGKDGERLYDENGNPAMAPSVTIVGSIDMIVLERETNLIFGFEHKTCKTFRDDSYVWMDEQPRVYTLALQHYVDEYNAKMYADWVEAGSSVDGEPVPAKLGGVFLNEVKKLLRDFQYERTLCSYPPDDLDNFMRAFYDSCGECAKSAKEDHVCSPSPNFFSCQLCDFKTICSTYMYGTFTEKQVLASLGQEYHKRTEDHLDEKEEKHGKDQSRVAARGG